MKRVLTSEEEKENNMVAAEGCMWFCVEIGHSRERSINIAQTSLRSGLRRKKLGEIYDAVKSEFELHRFGTLIKKINRFK